MHYSVKVFLQNVHSCIGNLKNPDAFQCELLSQNALRVAVPQHSHL